jgi:hypothetical protein
MITLLRWVSGSTAVAKTSSPTLDYLTNSQILIFLLDLQILCLEKKHVPTMTCAFRTNGRHGATATSAPTKTLIVKTDVLIVIMLRTWKRAALSPATLVPPPLLNGIQADGQQQRSVLVDSTEWIR